MSWPTFHLQYKQHNILVRLLTVNVKNCLNPKNPEMCDPIMNPVVKCDPIQRHIPTGLLQGSTPHPGI